MLSVVIQKVILRVDYLSIQIFCLSKRNTQGKMGKTRRNEGKICTAKLEGDHSQGNFKRATMYCMVAGRYKSGSVSIATFKAKINNTPPPERQKASEYYKIHPEISR